MKLKDLFKKQRPKEAENVHLPGMKLTELQSKFLPEHSRGYCDVSNNRLTSLEGCPKSVTTWFDASRNQLTSLEGIPPIMDDFCAILNNKLTNLHNIHKLISFTHMGFINAEGNPIVSHILGAFKVKNITNLYIDNKQVSKIVNRHLRGDRDILACQQELIEAGFEEYAQL